MTTEHDRLVLNSLLNPNLPMGEAVFDPEAGLEDQGEEQEQEAGGEKERLKELELKGMRLAEAGDLETAILVFTEAVNLAPSTASCYNNRAQALRLAGRSDGALADLNKALQLSGGKGKVAANAYCQRGALYRKSGEDEAAREDFQAAAQLGSGFAKSMLVEMNPYAAMCNAMLRNVFTALAEGKQVEDSH